MIGSVGSGPIMLQLFLVSAFRSKAVMKPSRLGRENSLPARAGSQCEEPGMQATIVSTDAELVPFWSAPIRDRRIAPALGLGFTSGMPFLLTYSTQSAWLTDAGVPLATIGLLSELTLAYKFKFVWAPFLDQYDPPLIGRGLGRGGGGLLVAMLGVMAFLAGIAFGDPGHWIWWTVGFSFALGIAGATLDLVLDGWRITIVRPPEQQAVLSSWTEVGWRVGNLAAGAGGLSLADHVGWKGAYLCMAGLMLVGIVATLLAPEPPSDMEPHKPHAGFVETIWAPIHDLLKRLGPMAAAILLLGAGFRMPGYIASAMAVPLFKSLTQNYDLTFANLAMRRTSCRVDAIRSHASAEVTEASQSLERRRQRLSHANVRSTTQRRATITKPFASSGRLTISIVGPSIFRSALSSFSPA